eukprot:g15058.t1
MGVEGLTTYSAPRILTRRHNLSVVAQGRVLVVDGYAFYFAAVGWWPRTLDMVLGLTTHDFEAELRGFLGAFARHNIRLVFVFDEHDPTEASRSNRWKGSLESFPWLSSLMGLEIKHITTRINNGDACDYQINCCLDMPPGLGPTIQRVLREEKVDIHFSGMADQMLVRLATELDAFGIVSRDADFLIFDSKPLIDINSLRTGWNTGFAKDQIKGDVYLNHQVALEKNLGIPRQLLPVLAVLCKTKKLQNHLALKSSEGSIVEKAAAWIKARHQKDQEDTKLEGSALLDPIQFLFRHIYPIVNPVAPEMISGRFTEKDFKALQQDFEVVQKLAYEDFGETEEDRKKFMETVTKTASFYLSSSLQAAHCAYDCTPHAPYRTSCTFHSHLTEPREPRLIALCYPYLQGLLPRNLVRLLRLQEQVLPLSSRGLPHLPSAHKLLQPVRARIYERLFDGDPEVEVRERWMVGADKGCGLDIRVCTTKCATRGVNSKTMEEVDSWEDEAEAGISARLADFWPTGNGVDPRLNPQDRFNAFCQTIDAPNDETLAKLPLKETFTLRDALAVLAAWLSPSNPDKESFQNESLPPHVAASLFLFQNARHALRLLYHSTNQRWDLLQGQDAKAEIFEGAETPDPTDKWPELSFPLFWRLRQLDSVRIPYKRQSSAREKDILLELKELAEKSGSKGRDGFLRPAILEQILRKADSKAEGCGTIPVLKTSLEYVESSFPPSRPPMDAKLVALRDRVAKALKVAEDKEKSQLQQTRSKLLPLDAWDLPSWLNLHDLTSISPKLDGLKSWWDQCQVTGASEEAGHPHAKLLSPEELRKKLGLTGLEGLTLAGLLLEAWQQPLPDVYEARLLQHLSDEGKQTFATLKAFITCADPLPECEGEQPQQQIKEAPNLRSLDPGPCYYFFLAPHGCNLVDCKLRHTLKFVRNKEIVAREEQRRLQYTKAAKAGGMADVDRIFDWHLFWTRVETPHENVQAAVLEALYKFGADLGLQAQLSNEKKELPGPSSNCTPRSVVVKQDVYVEVIRDGLRESLELAHFSLPEAPVLNNPVSAGAAVKEKKVRDKTLQEFKDAHKDLTVKEKKVRDKTKSSKTRMRT